VCQGGIIHPAATRRALADWRYTQRCRAADRDADEVNAYAVIWRPRHAVPETVEGLKRLLLDALALPGVKVTYPR